jgi:hypothetical protein
MMKRIADALPAAVIGIASGSVLFNTHLMSGAIDRVLPPPAGTLWLLALLLGAVSVVTGICLRTIRETRRRDVGQGLELVGLSLLGGMMLTYATALAASATGGLFGPSWLAILFIVSLAVAFLGPWGVILRELFRARHKKA